MSGKNIIRLKKKPENLSQFLENLGVLSINPPGTSILNLSELSAETVADFLETFYQTFGFDPEESLM